MSTDNYGMILARYARRGLVNTVNNLKYDSYWSLHGRMLYYYYLEANLTCSDVISRGQSKNP